MSRREELFSDAVNAKADAVPAKDVRAHESDPTVWFVRSSRTGTEHRVQFIEDWVTCTCQNGDVRVSRAKCYHASAAMKAKEKGKTDGD